MTDKDLIAWAESRPEVADALAGLYAAEHAVDAADARLEDSREAVRTATRELSDAKNAKAAAETPLYLARSIEAVHIIDPMHIDVTHAVEVWPRFPDSHRSPKVGEAAYRAPTPGTFTAVITEVAPRGVVVVVFSVAETGAKYPRRYARDIRLADGREVGAPKSERSGYTSNPNKRWLNPEVLAAAIAAERAKP